MFMRRMLTLLVLGAIACLWPASSSHASPDSNRDGLIDVVDVQYVVGAILSSAGSGVTGADVDGDGVVDVADIQKVVNEILAVPRPLLAWSPTSGTQAWVGIPYSLQLQSSGGQPGHTWSLVSGSLPPGLSLTAAGVISGTPGPAGTFSFTVRVTDASSATHDRNITLVVGTPEPAAITSSAVTTGMKGVPYRYQVTASGQPAPTISVTGLPAWLTYSSATGLISGMPGVPQIGTTGTVTITATNLLQPPATQSFSIAIAPQPVSKRTFDFNGDGYNDLVVGAPALVFGSSGPPAAVLVYCGRPVVPSTIDTSQADLMIVAQAGAEFGYVVSSAGDINGDYYDDLLVSEPLWDDQRGRVHIFFGGQFHPQTWDLTQTPADVTIVGAGTRDHLGKSMCSVGDFSGSGVCSFALGCNGPPYNYNGGQLGRVLVFQGRANWPSTLSETAAAVLVNGDNPGSEFGLVATGGDFNGDGKGDLVISANHHSETGSPSVGRAYILLGRSGTQLPLTASQVDVTISSNIAGGQLGLGACGDIDINGDGFDDILVSTIVPLGSVGGETRLLAYFGASVPASSRNQSNSDVVIGSPTPFAGGTVLLPNACGDLNGDGLDDVLIGRLTYSQFGGFGSGGGGYIVLGRTQWSSPFDVQGAACTIEGAASLQPLGKFCSGDFDGDGVSEVFSVMLAASAPFSNHDVAFLQIADQMSPVHAIGPATSRFTAVATPVSTFGVSMAAK